MMNLKIGLSVKYLFWLLLFVCQLIALSLSAWHMAAQVHFAYPVGYKLLDLETHIAEYAPLNRHKEDFEFTGPKEHWRLFGEITDAVQNSGRGLQAIRYTLSDGKETSLMHEAEIIHLQDVANLIDGFYRVGLISVILWFALIGVAIWRRWLPPSGKKVLLGFLMAIVATSAVVILIGPTDVFYWLHVQIFPPGHEWFFYYQDSLMTTLMKAPDIFAFISIMLLLLLSLFWAISFLILNRLIQMRLAI